MNSSKSLMKILIEWLIWKLKTNMIKAMKCLNSTKIRLLMTLMIIMIIKSNSRQELLLLSTMRTPCSKSITVSLVHQMMETITSIFRFSIA